MPEWQAIGRAFPSPEEDALPVLSNHSAGRAIDLNFSLTSQFKAFKAVLGDTTEALHRLELAYTSPQRIRTGPLVGRRVEHARKLRLARLQRRLRRRGQRSGPQIHMTVVFPSAHLDIYPKAM